MRIGFREVGLETFDGLGAFGLIDVICEMVAVETVKSIDLIQTVKFN
jgi:hypothetical protein